MAARCTRPATVPQASQTGTYTAVFHGGPLDRIVQHRDWTHKHPPLVIGVFDGHNADGSWNEAIYSWKRERFGEHHYDYGSTAVRP